MAKRKTTFQNGNGRKQKEDAERTQKDGRDRHPNLIVGVGASAGGLDPLKAFIKQFPEKPDMSFVFILHMEPKQKSLLNEIIERYTDMEVITVQDGLKVEKNKVYLMPPGKEILIEKRKLELMEREKVDDTFTPINRFFRSLAQDQADNAVAVILSGMGTDGTLGGKAVKEELGLVIAQDPSEAEYGSMPQSAIESGSVDLILPVEEMAARILDYRGHLRKTEFIKPKQQTLREEEESNLNKIFAILRSKTENDFSHYKRTTINRRLNKRMHVKKIDNLKEYQCFLEEDEKEVQNLFREFLIEVTSFFREPESFSFLKEEILPKIMKSRKSGESIRIWVPGCSTGEEAYSLAILLREYMEKNKEFYDVQLFATDVDHDVIEKARNGVYPDSVATDISEDRLKKYFQKQNSSYQINRDIREMIIFAVQNVIKDPPFTRLDLISCRNLLIYLTSDIQKKLLHVFHYSLRKEGFLFLGPSESVSSNPELFTQVGAQYKIFRKKKIGHELHQELEFPIYNSYSKHKRNVTKKEEEIDIKHELENFLIDNYAPAAVVVNENNNIVYVHGHTGAFLEPPHGKPDFNIIEMAREGLEIHISSGLRGIRSGEEDFIRHCLRVKTNGDHREIDLRITKLGENKQLEQLIVILFEEPKEKIEVDREEKEAPLPQEDKDRRIHEFENELRDSRESLQTSIEELETSNEELRSTNEEYQSTNEELQSANEELESSKEEMQSLNEELSTVNAELQTKIDEYASAYNEIRRFMENIGLPIIFLDTELRVKRFSSSASSLINLIDVDIGRPISHLSTSLKDANLSNDANKVLNSMRHIDREVESEGGTYYQMRITPYVGNSKEFEGVLITFYNITEKKNLKEKLKKTVEDLNYNKEIIKSIDQSILVLNSLLKIEFANPAFLRSFNTSQREIFKTSIFDIKGGKWDIPALHEFFDKVLPEKETVNDYQIKKEAEDGKNQNLLVSARRMELDGGEKIILWLKEK